MLFRTLTEAEFADIVSATKKVVLSAVRRNLDARFVDAVDDVVQETYLRAYRSLARGKFRGESALSSYLYVIARNEALRMNRRRGREDKAVTYESEISREIVDQRESTADAAERRLEHLRLTEMLERLPEKYRVVLRLYGAGRSQQEIAEELELEPGTVKSRTSRGKEMIRKMWVQGQDVPDPGESGD